MMQTQEIEANLIQFCGTENYYKHLSGLTYTDGIKFLAESAECYWLIDLIASYQRKLQVFGPFQLWTIEVEDNTAIVYCQEDTGQPKRVTQKIGYTDFPLKKLELYVMRGVLMLKGEY